MKNRRRNRNAKGQGIIEGTIGLIMVIGAGVVATLLILNSGAGVFFKQKLMPVTSMAAHYAAAHASDSDLQGETASFVSNLMPQVGMTPSNLNVTVQLTTVSDDPAVQVTIANQFPLFGTSNYLPSTMTLADTEVVVW